MDNQDRPKFAEALISLAEIYDREISRSLAEVYFADLSGYPLEAVTAAIATHRTDPERGRWFPKPADLVFQLDKVYGADHESLAADAWEATKQLARNIRTAHHSDPVAERAVQLLGGWSRIGLAGERDLTFIRKEFLERYVELSERDEASSEFVAALPAGQGAERIASQVSGLLSDMGKRS